MTPKNTIRVKNNTNECFAGNIVEKVSPWDKLFRKFKKCKLSVDKLLCKEARNILQVLFKDERRKTMHEKLSENIGKPKELWKIIKKLGLPDKNAPTTSVCLNTPLTFFSRTIANTLQILQVILLRNLLNQQENLEYPQCTSVTRKLTSVKKIKFEKLSSVSILKLLKNIKPAKLLQGRSRDLN